MLKGIALIRYLLNFQLDMDPSTEDLDELFSVYLHISTIKSIPYLESILKEKILFYKQDGNPPIALHDIIFFLDSLIGIYGALEFKEDNYLLNKEKLQDPVVIVSTSFFELPFVIARLLSDEDFVSKYYSLPINSDLYYYKEIINTKFYRGQTLFQYLASQDNKLIILLTALKEGWIEH